MGLILTNGFGFMVMGLVYDDGLGFKVNGFGFWRWVWF